MEKIASKQQPFPSDCLLQGMNRSLPWLRRQSCLCAAFCMQPSIEALFDHFSLRKAACSILAACQSAEAALCSWTEPQISLPACRTGTLYVSGKLQSVLVSSSGTGNVYVLGVSQSAAVQASGISKVFIGGTCMHISCPALLLHAS